jgi:hypothetical protein
MRYLAVVLILVFGLSFFTGCGKSPEGETNYNELRYTEPPDDRETVEGAKDVGQ